MAKSLTEKQKQELDARIQARLGFFDFWEFCIHMNPEFFEARPFLHRVAVAFMWVYDMYMEGYAKKVAVSMPPRAGKSYITSLFCAWWLGKLPKSSVMRNACTGRLYEKFSYDVRAIIRSDKYRQVFDEVELAGDKQALEGWNLTTSVQVGYFGAGTGGTIIGFGANIAISDDLYKGIEDAMSETVNEKTHLWKEGSHDSRMEKNCPEIFIGTRWTKTDVIGVALEKDRIDKYLKISALDENGETFCDAVKSTAEYQSIKADIDEVIWDAEYQQEPAENKGALFPKSQLHFYDPEKITFEPEHKLVYVDPANEGGDNLAAPLGYLVGDKIYIPHVICNNHGTDINEQAVIDLINSERAHAARLESNSAWYLFAKAVKKGVLEKNPDCDIRSLINSTHKGTRILAQSGFIRNRFIFRSDYEKFPDYKRFMKSLTGYMRDGGDNQNDDAPDSAAGMAVYYRKQFPHLF